MRTKKKKKKYLPQSNKVSLRGQNRAQDDACRMEIGPFLRLESAEKCGPNVIYTAANRWPSYAVHDALGTMVAPPFLRTSSCSGYTRMSPERLHKHAAIAIKHWSPQTFAYCKKKYVYGSWNEWENTRARDHNAVVVKMTTGEAHGVCFLPDNHPKDNIVRPIVTHKKTAVHWLGKTYFQNTEVREMIRRRNCGDFGTMKNHQDHSPSVWCR